MKKLALFLAAAFLFTASATMAQRGGFSPEKQKAMYKDSLGVTDAIADSMVAIDGRYRTKMMDMRKSGTSRDDMMAQMKAGQEAKNEEIKKILPADAYTKYQAIQERRRAEMKNRMGGGRGGNN